MQLANPATYEVDLDGNRARLEQLRKVVGDAERVALLLQDDPDPDGIASAIALRTVLGRNRSTTPIFTFGQVTRAENLAMIRLLDVTVEPVDTETLRAFPRVALLDVQPGYFGERLPHVHIVIDHHPRCGPIDAEFCDVRTNYGATSTILTEYLEAAGADVSQRLATALLYGIKSDTLMLNRETGPADLRAFMALYPLTNYNVLRRIERPELPLAFASFLARILPRIRKRDELLTLYVGHVDREDVIPQLADFCMQFENTEWVVVAGKSHDSIVMSVRNPGYVRSAGELVRRLFGSVGRAGGHRSMAKAIVPVRAWRKAFGSTRDRQVAETIELLFWRELYGEGAEPMQATA
ncbi:MAG: bifunctional oligoribonuclease/PAP phosphatase NrnA [Candidatus Binatia bacterium]|nr:bifunctional oligoribonuclease/PAP phosphatase NrnA [Candidatus Binatia bacterium]